MAPVAEQSTDGRSKDRMTNYTKFWEGDLKNNGDEHNENRLSSYTEVVNGTLSGFHAVCSSSHVCAGTLRLL